MDHKEVSADVLFRNVSRQLGVPVEALRSFAEREHIDAIALYHEKRAAMEWKRDHGTRVVWGRPMATIEGRVEVQKKAGNK